MILVVEDNDLITDWLREVIQEAGYYFDSAIDALSALYKIRGIQYSMALIDINLNGEISGDELAVLIKALPEPTSSLPLIAMTGGAALPSETQKLFKHVLYKPFLPRDLREVIGVYANPPTRDLHEVRTTAETGEKPCL